MSSRYLIQSVQFDEDSVITVTYMDKNEALRIRGAVFQSQAVSVAPDAGPMYAELAQVRRDVEEFLQGITELYRDTVAFVPEDEDDEDDLEEDRGLGF